jgi:hypothetical protein
MNSHSNKSRDQFLRAIDFLIEEIESLSPAELRTSLDEMGISATDAQSMVKRALESCQKKIGALKFAEAKQALKERPDETSKVVSISGAKAKAALQSYWKKNPSETPTTLAARKGVGISEETALKIYQSLVDLGAISPEDDPSDV